MALPSLSAAQRKAALEKAAQVRKERAQMKKDLKEGKIKLSQVLSIGKENSVAGKMKVSALLTSLPGIGDAKAAAIMEQIGIAHSRRVAGLGPHQAEELKKIFG